MDSLGYQKRSGYVERGSDEFIVLEEYDYGDNPPDFYRALERLRGQVGQELDWIGTRYKIEIKGDLKTILPP